jgi:hypothetical protein
MKKQAIGRFIKNCVGATIVEFAIVAPVFFLLLAGIVEYGLYTFSSVAIESAVMQAARTASLGKSSDKAGSGRACEGTADRVGYIKCVLRDKTSSLINADTITITANLVANGGVPASVSPDICMTDPPTVGGPCPKDTPWQDVNGNNKYDPGTAMTEASMGNAGDLVEVRVYYPWKVQIPFMKSFFGCRGDQAQAGCKEGIIMISSSTVLKNEPFDTGGGSSGSGSGGSSTSASSSGTGTSASGTSASGTSASSTSSTSASSSTGGTSASSSTTSASSTSSTSASSSTGGGGGGCFTGDALITMANGNKKPISELKLGEQVRGETRINKVLIPETHESAENIYGFNGGSKFVTGEHLLMTTKGWRAIDPELVKIESKGKKTAEKLQLGDTLVMENKETLRIESIDVQPPGDMMTLYNPSLDGDHTYYANGILVHNIKSVGCISCANLE